MKIYAWINKQAEKLSKSRLGFIIFLYRYVKYILNGQNNIFTKNDAIIIKNIDKIASIIPMLEDEKSKKIYYYYTYMRMNKNIIYTGIAEKSDNEYIIDELKLWGGVESIVDAGAYTGDSITLFEKVLNNKIDKVFAFEADANTYHILKETVEKSKFSQKVIMFNLALFSENTTLSFNSNSGPVSSIANDGHSFVKAVKIDDIITERITFIKMDIEGAEMDALIGAEKILKRDRPKLAICIYHKPAHLWEIPIYLKAIVPEYKFYIRKHSLFFDDIVLYAVI
jgi:FkbM family methyltransferase